jgi:metal-responsive CopG/Arc/MetJ family transcriptional regulator
MRDKPKLVRTSVQLPQEHLDLLDTYYPEMSRSEAIRMAVERAIEEPAIKRPAAYWWEPVQVEG